jgi:hypothetical protein
MAKPFGFTARAEKRGQGGTRHVAVEVRRKRLVLFLMAYLKGLHPF